MADAFAASLGLPAVHSGETRDEVQADADAAIRGLGARMLCSNRQAEAHCGESGIRQECTSTWSFVVACHEPASDSFELFARPAPTFWPDASGGSSAATPC